MSPQLPQAKPVGLQAPGPKPAGLQAAAASSSSGKGKGNLHLCLHLRSVEGKGKGKGVEEMGTTSACHRFRGDQGLERKPACKICGDRYKWAKMLKEQWWEEEEDDWGERKCVVTYTCRKCVQKAQGFHTEKEAWDYILKSNGVAEKKRRKVEAFQDARKTAKQSFSALAVEMSSRDLYQVTRKSMLEVFDGIMDLIALKVKSMQALSVRVHANDALRKELKDCKDVQRIAELVELISDENAKYHEMMAFKAEKGTDWKKWQASTFHDEYVSSQASSGALKICRRRFRRTCCPFWSGEGLAAKLCHRSPRGAPRGHVAGQVVGVDLARCSGSGGLRAAPCGNWIC